MTLSPRLGRLLGEDGRCLDVAIDHGVFDEPGFLSGIEDMERAVDSIVRAGPDAVQLGPGHAPLLARRPGARKPALVLRVDVTNVYGATPEPPFWCELLDDPVGEALRLDAACVVVFLLKVPGHAELQRQCVANLLRIRGECSRYGMPLLVEPIAMKPGPGGALVVDGDPRRIASLVRQAVELGADLVKADPPDDLAALPDVLRVAGGRPLLVRGGSRGEESDVLRRTRAVIEAGASGIVYGRNIIQHPDPAAITRAFLEIVHGPGGGRHVSAGSG